MKLKTAEILCVGTEILIGDIVNTNAAYLSRALASLGIAQYRQSVVGDNPARLQEAFAEARARADLVILSGGLGPTYDDLTKETVSAALGVPLVLHAESLARIKAYFKLRGRPYTDNNEKQAMIPQGAIVLQNDCGTAPGIYLADETVGKAVLWLPGPPSELVPMFETYALPILRAATDRVLVSHNVHLVGIGESRAEFLLRDRMATAENPTIAPYCGEGEVRLRITAQAATLAEGEEMCAAVIAELQESAVAPYIYGVDTDLASAVVAKLAACGKKVATAESCTGGLVAKLLTDVAGASAVTDGGVVAYANHIKTGLLGVCEESIAAYTEVSEQVAGEMARGVAKLYGADLAVSTTGYAGPGGGTAEHPVGTVCFGIYADGKVHTLTANFSGNRARIRTYAAKRALELLFAALTA